MEHKQRSGANEDHSKHKFGGYIRVNVTFRGSIQDRLGINSAPSHATLEVTVVVADHVYLDILGRVGGLNCMFVALYPEVPIDRGLSIPCLREYLLLLLPRSSADSPDPITPQCFEVKMY